MNNKPKFLLVGSAALQAIDVWNDVAFRAAKDIDLFGTKSDWKATVKMAIAVGKVNQVGFSTNGESGHVKLKSGTIIECSFTDLDTAMSKSNAAIFEWCKQFVEQPLIGFHRKNTTEIEEIGDAYIAPKVICFLMKMSHRFKKDSVHFEKTRQDVKWFTESELYSLETDVLTDEKLTELYNQRCKATYTNKPYSLNKTKSTFFVENVPYKYEHDDLHEAVAILNKPAYTFYMQDGAQVQCSKEKFFALPEHIRILGVLEESYVLALERSVIPFGADPKKAFDIALEKVCTSITSGWFREYAYNNYDNVQASYSDTYVKKFKKALAENRIRLYNSNSTQDNSVCA